MSKRCIISGKKTYFGNNVSHANNKSRRTYFPNLQTVSFTSDVLNRSIRLKVSTNAIRTIEFKGGLDAFLNQVASKNISPELAPLYKQFKKAQQRSLVPAA